MKSFSCWAAASALSCFLFAPHSQASEGKRQSSIYGGTEVETCNWSATVISDIACSGTLIHPRVITSAAHCEPGENTIWKFGERTEGEFSIKPEKCYANPEYDGGTGGDWSYCILPEDPRLAAYPFIPPLVGCEREAFLKPGVEATAVGFGTLDWETQQGGGIKREVVISINSFKDNVVNAGDENGGVCSGDSGGPLFMHLIGEDGSDWGWRTVASTSGASSGENVCKSAALFAGIPPLVRHIEENEGIDVTPCTDKDGAWDPGPACVGLATNPAEAGGTWPNCNFGPKTSVPIDSCGVGIPGPDGGDPGGTGGMGNGGMASGGVAGDTGSAGAAGGGQGGDTGNAGAAVGGTAGDTSSVAGAASGGIGGDSMGIGGATAGTGSLTPGGATGGVPSGVPNGMVDNVGAGPNTGPIAANSGEASGCSLLVQSEPLQTSRVWWLAGLAATLLLRRRRFFSQAA